MMVDERGGRFASGTGGDGASSPKRRKVGAVGNALASKLLSVLLCAKGSSLVHSFPHTSLTTTRTSSSTWRTPSRTLTPEILHATAIHHRALPWNSRRGGGDGGCSRRNLLAFRGGGGDAAGALRADTSTSASFAGDDAVPSPKADSLPEPSVSKHHTSTAPSIQRLREFGSRNFFVLGMIVAVTLARLAPALGTDGGLLRPELVIGRYGVALIFLLSGLSLEPSSIASALSNVKLLGIIQLLSFGVWPIAGLAIRALLLRLVPTSVFPPALADGVLMVTTLPTTVNMCVILTGSANGNVATALCNAALGNVLGVVLTPAWLLHLFGSSVSVPIIDLLRSLTSKVALPVGVGQLLRFTPAKDLYQRYSKFFKRTQEVILLSILWNAFCTAFSSRIGLAWSQIAALLIFLPILHWTAFELIFRFLSIPKLQLSKHDVVAGAFCASQKTLAFGLPLLRTVFQGSPHLVAYCAPLMLIHPVQLVVGTFLLPKLKQYTSVSSPSGTSDDEKDS